MTAVAEIMKRTRGRRRESVSHAQPCASVVAFAWTLFLMMTLHVLLDRRWRRTKARRRPLGDFFGLLKLARRASKAPSAQRG